MKERDKTKHTKQAFIPRVPLLCARLSKMDTSGRLRVAREEATSARRRLQRRLRSWLRHERLSIAMALEEQLHHSVQRVERNVAPRRQTTRAREEVEHVTYHAPRGQNTPPPAAGPQYFSFDDDDGPAEGRRPDALREPASHGSLRRNVVYIFGDPLLDVPALQMVDEVVEVLADVVQQPVVDPGEEVLPERTSERLLDIDAGGLLDVPVVPLERVSEGLLKSGGDAPADLLAPQDGDVSVDPSQHDPVRIADSMLGVPVPLMLEFRRVPETVGNARVPHVLEFGRAARKRNKIVPHERTQQNTGELRVNTPVAPPAGSSETPAETQGAIAERQGDEAMPQVGKPSALLRTRACGAGCGRRGGGRVGGHGVGGVRRVRGPLRPLRLATHAPLHGLPWEWVR